MLYIHCLHANTPPTINIKLISELVMLTDTNLVRLCINLFLINLKHVNVKPFVDIYGRIP